ncbi:MAG TPA: trypsin-like peptidase domain-containing protein [Jatrophihabitans sp.]|nr:trypsin-like peptidase domain-containing protein [Jatrophihabitans sp.]
MPRRYRGLTFCTGSRFGETVIARAAIVLTALVAIGLACASPALADPPAPPGTPTATSFAGTPTVGPLFRDGLSADHECTASVVASPSRDLILTAAHCVFGTAAGWLFVPGYDRGATPYGVWTVTGAYVDARWRVNQDPHYDYALLRVAPAGAVHLQDVTGAHLLGVAARSGETITDIAYNAGRDDDPIRCTTTAYRTDGYPSFNCHGYVGGSSGSPWLTVLFGGRLTIVRGVIGGLHQGGCFEYTSYSSPFTWRVYGLLARASRHAPPDVVPEPGGDGC